jgi:hypothetical protein
MGSDTDTRWERNERTFGRLLLVVVVTAAVAAVPVAASVTAGDGGRQAAQTDDSPRGGVEFVDCTTMRVSDDVDEVAISYFDVEAGYDGTVWVQTDGDSTVEVPFLGLPSIALASYDGDADGAARDPLVYGGDAPAFQEQCVEKAKRASDPTSIHYGATKTASVSGPDPSDEVTFWGERGDVVTVEMRSANLDVAADNVASDEGVRDPTLVLEGPDGRVLARNDNGGDGDDARIFTFPLSASGEYTIVAAEGAESSLTSGASRNYELSLSLAGGTSDENSDGDSIVDAQEEHLGTDPTDRDTDGDGYWDGHEVNVGTDPTDADVYPSSISSTSDGGDAASDQTGDSSSAETTTDANATETTAAPTTTETQSTDTETATETETSTADSETEASESTATATPQYSDGDSLSDAREREVGTDPTDRDTDGDGYWDGHEVNVGSDPLDPDDTPGSP